MKILTVYSRFSKFKVSATAIVVALLITGSLRIRAQSDSLLVISEEVQDTINSVKRLDPRKALLFSAAFPGLGQIYNGKYWKLPLVYGGFAITFSVVNYYHKIYGEYKDDLYIFLATGKSPSGRTETNIRYIVDKARRERDYYVIISGIWYILQIVDAHVDAHLQEFKVNKDLRVSLNPSVHQNMLTGRTTGFSLTFKF